RVFGRPGKRQALNRACNFLDLPPNPATRSESTSRTALREWAYARAYHNSDQRSVELLHWLHRYNWHRPHGSLNNTPISRLGLSEDNLLRLPLGAFFPHLLICCAIRSITGCHNTC